MGTAAPWQTRRIDRPLPSHEAVYDHFGWRLRASRGERTTGRLAETHEYFHRQLDDTTAFGGLTSVVAALADALPESGWFDQRRQLISMSDLVHETFAVGMSLLTTQRRIEPIDDYPTYDRHVRAAQRPLGSAIHPWVALAGLRAAATACMQSAALAAAVDSGLAGFDPSRLPLMDRPNHRLAALLKANYADAVAAEQARASTEHGMHEWWQPAGDVMLTPDAMDGAAATASAAVHRRLLDEAAAMLRLAGSGTVDPERHHDQLRALLAEARALAPAGLTRIGALVEAPGGDLLHGGPLDGQIIELTTTPSRVVILPATEVSGLSGEGDRRHAFVVVTTPRRIRAAFDVQGVPLPECEALACLRTTIFEGSTRDSILLLPVERPETLDIPEPVFVSVMSSAAAADPEGAAAWMRWADTERVSMVMDTPATAALRRWCANGASFRTDTRLISLDGDEEIRVIVGRVEEPGRRSPLVIIPSTEFGARWFEAARAEDAVLGAAVIEDPDLFERESDHLDVVLGHLLLEERFVGTGSWRQ